MYEEGAKVNKSAKKIKKQKYEDRSGKNMKIIYSIQVRPKRWKVKNMCSRKASQ